MSLPQPRPGMVVRHGFLWSGEAAQGAEEAAKDRPCTIIVAAKRGPDGEITTILAPITHAPPRDPGSSLELPSDIARSLGLDEDRNWIRFDELNRLVWPGFDLRPIPERKGAYVYGDLPKAFFDKLRIAILERAAKPGSSHPTSRD